MTLRTPLLHPIWIMGITSFLDIIMGNSIMVTTNIRDIMGTMGTMVIMDIMAAGSQVCNQKVARGLQKILTDLLQNSEFDETTNFIDPKKSH